MVEELRERLGRYGEPEPTLPGSHARDWKLFELALLSATAGTSLLVAAALANGWFTLAAMASPTAFYAAKLLLESVLREPRLNGRT